jgi:tetratricopeptide (TPR) repeat protein
VFISVLGLIAMALCIPALKKKRPLLSFGLAWYLICLIPKFYGVLNVVAAEHHFYLPSIGIFIMAAWLSVSFYKRYKPVYTAIAVIMIGIFSVMVWMRNFQWQDSVRLWKAALKVDPQSEIAWHNVGADYLDKKDFTNAQKCFQKSLELSTKGKVNVESRIGLAMVMAARRQFAEAEALLKETLALHPTYSGTYLFLGKLYKDAGELKKAEEAWMQGLRLDPGSSHMYVGLGVLYLEQEKLAQAKEQFQKALAANPDSGMAYFGLGQVYERIASFDQAIGAYEKAVRLNPGHAKTHYCLGTLYAKRNDTRAFWHLQEAVRLDPDFAEAHNNLAVFYASLNPPKLSHAREHAQKALKLGYAVDKRFLESIGLSGR